MRFGSDHLCKMNNTEQSAFHVNAFYFVKCYQIYGNNLIHKVVLPWLSSHDNITGFKFWIKCQIIQSPIDKNGNLVYIYPKQDTWNVNWMWRYQVGTVTVNTIWKKIDFFFFFLSKINFKRQMYGRLCSVGFLHTLTT